MVWKSSKLRRHTQNANEIKCSDTVITVIPSRRNSMRADSLLETIRQDNLNTLRSPNDLIRKVMNQTVSFPDEFEWAGLGQHILDVFDEELSLEVGINTGSLMFKIASAD